MLEMRWIFVAVALFGAFASSEDIDTEDFQCHILYEYDASTKGTLSSPFYGKRPVYHNGLWCESRIRAPEGYRIKLTFKDFDIDPSSGCVQDKLIVYGKDKQSILAMLCGSQLPRPILSNEGENEVRFLFQTDYMRGGRGFLIEYESSPYMSFPVVKFPEECGNPPIKPKTTWGAPDSSPDRIVGGEPVIPNSWPWQVSLQYSFSDPNGHFCGGTLINAQWVVTATHCVVGSPYPGGIKIHLGAHSKYKKTQYEQVRISKKVIAYPDLELDDIRRYSMNDDVSLIKLNAPVKFNDGVQPACMPSLGWQLQPGTICYVTGWGESRGSGGAEFLKQSDQMVQSKENCSVNEHTQICVAKHQSSPCHGDSGGPLSCQLGDKWYVFGAASWVTTTNFMSGLCTGPGAKTVYANVADKAEWIKTMIDRYS
ncbi:chymotrypsin-like elastase family member 2B isoform X2 [Stegodyphus dumicola]|uniref:chymotrypsin-like elastase family member 2B isoform X2 n=1 Tax=Stegodyphus dumicola TaxID=202533 RepID=UPI0015B2DF33|nr:chymotrypsin-like elastase family member 2B isoform X2 [Stegodyphus dumicola]